MYRLNHLTRVAALGTLALVASCQTDNAVLGSPSLATGDIFKSYVAIGNSITAGVQSGGINDSTQRQSYARLLAGSMGTQYHYASLNMPGCVAPIANTQTGARVAGASGAACALRAGASVTDVLNNVAVPSARVLDPVTPSTVASNPLTTFILGGKTQVQRALDARPTFTSIWIGNNDVLEAGGSGILVPLAGVSAGIVSTQAQFQTSYDAMIKQLTDSMPNLKGVLIGVVQVSGVALLSSGGLIASSPTLQGGISAAAGVPVVIHPSCTGSTSLINVPSFIQAVRAYVVNPADPKGHPPFLVCAKGQAGFPAIVGDIFVLDAAEQVTLSSAITAYNDYIKTKAQAIGFAYYDPNPLLAAQRAAGNIPPFPNLASTSATFGTLFSLDGVHPSAAAHVLIANELITAINAKYSTTLKPVQ
ncbi:MAG: SGNH/GDSL hydrolase family protein [Gemmatimonadaceae bacterium]